MAARHHPTGQRDRVTALLTMVPMSPSAKATNRATGALALPGLAVSIITVSDRASHGTRENATGPLLVAAFADLGAVTTHAVVADEVPAITQALADAIAAGARAVITTGGTGIGPRDVTPEATAPLLAQNLPGVPELLRQRDVAANPFVALSRALAGLTAAPQRTLIVNLPGSVSAVTSALEVLPAIVAHACAQIDGGDH